MKILFACSTGGHLAQLYCMRPWWEAHDRAWVTFTDSQSQSLLSGERVYSAYAPTTRNVPNAVRNLGLAIRVLRAERPDVVISDGAGVAVPFFVAARAAGIRTAYLEVYDRITRPTLSGRLCYPLSDLFLLQWPEQAETYPRGQLVGGLL